MSEEREGGNAIDKKKYFYPIADLIDVWQECLESKPGYKLEGVGKKDTQPLSETPSGERKDRGPK